jgi:hypothetical protein
MVNRRFARFLLIFTALLLPLQSMAAVTMTFARQDVPATAMEATGEHEHCQHHQAATDVPDVAQNQQTQQDCDNCGICHLACSGYMPAAEVKTEVAPPAQVYQSGLVVARQSHIPEPPGYPPRRI